MRNAKCSFFCFLATLIACSAISTQLAHAQSSINPARVLMVYNANFTTDADHDGVQDSLEVANYYAEKRGVPPQNILAVYPTVRQSYNAFSQLEAEILNPLKTKLNALGPTNIDIILFSMGMPYQYGVQYYGNLSLDNLVMGLDFYNANNIEWNWPNPYFDPAPGFDLNFGHFDHSIYKLSGNTMYLVSRLDSPLGVNGVLNMIDSALYGEKFISLKPGYYNGNAYVDCENRATRQLYTDSYLSSNEAVRQGLWDNYNNGDLNIAYAEHFIEQSGLPLKWERTTRVIGEQGAMFQDSTSGLTAPNALLYGGWYNYNHYEAGAWNWLPGSIATDVDSSSLGYSFTAPFSEHYNPAWGVNALANGLTAVCGVSAEPGLDGAPRPNNLMDYLLQGYSFAEASALSIPDTGWMEVCLGDPMYTPFGAKDEVLDTLPPAFAAGYPQGYQSVDEGNVVKVLIDDSIEPKAVLMRMDYGTTPSYGQTMLSSGYYRRYGFVPEGLLPSTLYHYQITVVDPVGHTTTSKDLTFATPAETPYGNGPAPIPGTIQFYEFDNGGEGVAYHDVDIQNMGPKQPRADTGVEIANEGNGRIVVTGAYPTEWLKYTVEVASTRNYTLLFQVSNAGAPGGQFHLEQDGVNVSGTITIPTLSGFGTFSVPNVPLTVGQHVLRFVWDVASKGYATVGVFQDVQFQ